MRTREEDRMLAEAKVGDSWYRHLVRSGVSLYTVTKVSAARVTLSNGVQLNRRTGLKVGYKTYDFEHYYPATQQNQAEFEPMLELQALQKQFRNISDSVLEKHRKGILSSDDYRKLVAVLESV